MPKRQTNTSRKNPFSGSNSTETITEISKIIQDFDNQTARIFLKVYRDQASRTANADPIQVVELNVPTSEYLLNWTDTELRKGNRSSELSAFAYMQTQPEFGGVEIV